MTVKTFLSDMLLLSVFMLLGFFVREKVKPLQKLFLPSSLIGGLILLILGPQLLNVMAVPESFSGLPSALIDVVMASLVFGVSFNKDKIASYLDYTCVPMTAYGMQMAVGMVLSTFGLIVAMLVGMALVNFGVRRGWATYVKEPKAQPDHFYGGVLPEEKRTATGHTVTTGISINHLALQGAWLLAALFLGRKLFDVVSLAVPAVGELPSVLRGVFGGAVLWQLLKMTKLDKYVDLKTIKLISGFLLEIVVFTAMATLDVEFVSTYIAPILIYTLVIVVFTVPIVLFSAYRFCKTEWFEKAMMAFGAATGNTSTGLALVRAVDPDSQSSAGDTHGVYTTLTCWKDAFVGLTPVWILSGLGLTMGVGIALMVGFFIFGFLFFDRRRRKG